MFENLRDAFREAVKNFKEELHRDDVPEAVDRLVHGMKREATDARLRIQELEEAVRRARFESSREAREVETCRRRERMAEAIGDAETAAVAAEYGARHERRRAVLEQKADALQQELELLRAEAEEMIGKIREAENARDALTATAGREDARRSVREGEDLLDELDRMADRLSGGGRRASEVDDLLGELDRELGRDVDDARPPADAELDARLAELKRRMGKT